MKTLFFSLSLIISTALSAQTIDQLKKENEKLKIENQALYQNNTYLFEKLSYHNTLAGAQNQVKPFDTNFEIKVLSCIGNTATQEVTLILVYINKTTNKQIFLDQNKSFAVDGIGKSYQIQHSRNEQIIPILTTGIETRISYNVKNILPGTDTFNIVTLLQKSTDVNSSNLENYKTTEIRNVKITWVN